MLTKLEQDIIDLTAELSRKLSSLDPDGIDKSEWIFYIHGIQNMVLANGTARETPGVRLTGSKIYETTLIDSMPLDEFLELYK